MNGAATYRLALVGARGYTGRELLSLLAHHPAVDVAVAASNAQAGQPLADEVPEWPEPDQRFSALAPGDVAGIDADIWVLAVPNGHSGPWVEAISSAHARACIVDLGADHRFDGDWVYGLTEFERDALAGAHRISNPGCYATGAQFGLRPLREALAEPPVIFGVSGYSGAGRTPSPRNDPRRLAGNLVPYSLTGHVHEREIGARLGRAVRFHPHVAPFFRGISLTIAVALSEPVDAGKLLTRFERAYAGEALIGVDAGIPEIAALSPRTGLRIGGFAVDQRDPCRASFVVVLDNLLKGAASQALQNINLALGIDERTGVEGGRR